MARRPTPDEVVYGKRAAAMLLLPTSTWATGTVLFHRYCDYVSKQSGPGGDIIPAHICILLCLYLATKVTEEPRKYRDIINVGFKLEHPESDFLPVGPRLDALRDTMIQGELTLVRILGFNVDVELPHVWIASILYGMAWWEQGGVPAKDTELVDDQIKYVARLAWKIANRVVSAGLVDREPVQALAATCVLLSLEADGVPLPAKNLSEWTSAWARSPLSQVERTRRLVEERVDIALCRQERDADNSHHHLNKHGWSSDLQ